MTDVNGTSNIPMQTLRDIFGDALKENVAMAGYTTARVGGKADALVVLRNAHELESAVKRLWAENIAFHLIGSGANVLVSDNGLRGVVLINRANAIQINADGNPPTVRAESGAIFSSVARQAALHGLSGLEWACAVPGTVGGAVYGNAGAFGGDVNGSLLMAEILQQSGKIVWSCEEMSYSYRSSRLKRSHEPAIILAATMNLKQSDTATVQAQMDTYSDRRRSTQPPGASMGSMFKNPPGDHAGRLIEAAGLKGTRIGGAEVSKVHANFFVNNENATASDLYQLIRLVQSKVLKNTNVLLELEVELLGDWQE
ncbi:MAG: UDP-N-acetylmuramate dehydrogenase [Anaerolineae bacterium]|nr:UDP-N-acetylmuramate dehydrogenase [Anaerolineae bacterium]